MMHCDKLALPFSVPVKELWDEHFILCLFEIDSHPMDRVIFNEKLDSRHSMKSLKGDLLPYYFNVDESVSEGQFVSCYAMVGKLAGYFWHSIAQSFLQHFDRTMTEQMSFHPMEDEQSVFVSKKNTELANKSQSGEVAHCSNLSNSYSKAF